MRPVTNLQTLPGELAPAPEDASQWMEGRLIADMVSSSWEALLILLLVVPVMFALLHSYVWRPGLYAWSAAALGITAYRLHVMAKHRKDFANALATEQQAFLQRYGFAWPLSAFIWASSTWLHFDVAPEHTQFICWVIVIAIVTFAVISSSAHLKTMRLYVNVYAATCFVIVIWDIIFRHGFVAPGYEYYVMLMLVAVYWFFLIRTGTRQHKTLRASLQLQQANAELIRSLKEQTRTALEAVQVKNRFIASAAHDLRQPVHALSLYADWLRNEPDMGAELAPKILQSTKAVNELFDALFDLVRLDSGKFKPDWRELSLDDIARDLLVQYTPLAEDKGIQLRLRVASAYAWSDPIMLRRILGNLLSNAIKHTVQGGVLLAIRPHGETVRLEIWDSGIGIAPEHQQMIFREFYRVPMHQGTEEGFGLGLSIVSRLAVALGHPLSLQSRLGRGTVFRLTLPLARSSDFSASSSF